jgi:hypothetical protein
MAHRSRACARSVLPLLLAAVLPAAAMAAASTAAPAADKASATQRPLRCEPTLGRDKLMVVCSIDASQVRLVRVRVHLTGSHDDTTASMEVAIGDVPATCDADSKTSTEGEDGDVTLACRFITSGGSGAATTLRAMARWFHAHYVGFEVDERQP